MANIIIIGAGISGLSIARTLLESGHTITILEARDRMGGRIHTLRTEFSTTVEAGAEFILEVKRTLKVPLWERLKQLYPALKWWSKPLNKSNICISFKPLFTYLQP